MELVDVYDPFTEDKNGDVISKEEAHRLGIWHSSIHILIFNDNKVLLQKRCASKDLYPNMWDISVGGHISSGEDKDDAATRELFEELGIKVNNLEYIGKTKEQFLNNGLDSREISFIYIVKEKVNIEDIKLQVEEVSDAKYFNLEEFEELVKENKIINHPKEFEIIRNILK